MIVTFRWLIFIFCFINYSYFAQVSEFDKFDCNYSKEIIIPFDYIDSKTSITPPLNQVVFYSYRDQFTYWYKIIAKQNDTLQFKISTLNDSDAFSVFIYQYNNTDFCNKLYQQKIKPYLNSIDIGNGSKDIGFTNFIVKKDQIYYLSVLNTSINNCGHQLKLLHQIYDTLVVKAIHLPCKKDIAALDVNQKSIGLIVSEPKNNSIVNNTILNENPIRISDSVSVISKPIIEPVIELTNLSSKKFECSIKNAKTSNLVAASISIIDLDTKDYLVLDNDSNGYWKGNYEDGKLYKIKVNAFGYKDLEIQRQFNQNNKCELFLEPLKVGENFVMKSIYFHPNTYALKKASYNDLQKLLDYLSKNPSVIIEIQGHTNGDNKIHKNKAYESLSEEWNFQGSSKKLSLKRAEAIKSFLVTNGISEDRLNYQGFGGEKPIVKNPETMEDGQKNIRVEIKILQN